MTGIGNRRRYRRWSATTGALVAATACLAGCATGNTASDPLLGSLLPSGGYTLSKDELTWSCGGLENAINARVNRIAALQATAKVETTNAAPTLERFFTRMTEGTGADSPSLASIKTERSAADAYNARLKSNGCGSVDIDAQIASADPPKQPVAPSKGPELPILPSSITGIVGQF